MRLQFHVSVLLLALLVFPVAVHSQGSQTPTNTLVDVFPLAIGNQWTYRYFTLTVIWPAGNPVETRTDSGIVTYQVSDQQVDTDSTRWQVHISRDLMRHQILYPSSGDPHDTTYPIRDSSYLDLIESHQGQHQVYRNADPYSIRLDVFPFTRDFVDTTLIYRFRQVGTGDTISFRSWIVPVPAPLFRSTFTFRKDLGLIRNSYNSGTVDVYSTNEHLLLNSIITTASSQTVLPSSFALYQNHPNPFNPSTTISFQLPREGRVILKVFDVLGREVATLVDGAEEPGYKSVQWDAAGVASGVYFFRLKAGDFVASKKMLLLK